MHNLPQILVTAARKTGEIWPTSWREAARGLIISLYEGTDLDTITIYCGVLLILAIIAASLVIAFAAAARKKADLFYLTRMERLGTDPIYAIHRSVR